MSVASHIIIKETENGFPISLIKDIEKEIEKNKSYIDESFISDTEIFLNLKKPERFETIYVSSKKNKGSYLPLPLPNELLYTGFKYTQGDKNIFACKLLILIKYHLRENVTISSDGFRDYISCDWKIALDYINNAYNYKIDISSDAYGEGIFTIDDIEIANSYNRNDPVFKVNIIREGSCKDGDNYRYVK